MPKERFACSRRTCGALRNTETSSKRESENHPGRKELRPDDRIIKPNGESLCPQLSVISLSKASPSAGLFSLAKGGEDRRSGCRVATPGFREGAELTNAHVRCVSTGQGKINDRPSNCCVGFTAGGGGTRRWFSWRWAKFHLVSERRLSLADQLRQFSDVGRDASRLIAREQIGCSAPSGLGLEIHVSQRLSVVVADDETTAVVFLNVPRRGKRRGSVMATATCRVARATQQQGSRRPQPR